MMRTQIRPACQLSGTVKLTAVYAPASHLSNGGVKTDDVSNGIMSSPRSLVRNSASDVQVCEDLVYEVSTTMLKDQLRA